MDLQEMIEIQKDNGTTLDEMRAVVEKVYAESGPDGVMIEVKCDPDEAHKGGDEDE